MLWIHEVHRTWGKHEDEFEAIYRDEWMPAVARNGDAKLLYYAHLTHGSGRAYTVITVTAARDAAAWGNVGERVTQRFNSRSETAYFPGIEHRNVFGRKRTTTARPPSAIE